MTKNKKYTIFLFFILFGIGVFLSVFYHQKIKSVYQFGELRVGDDSPEHHKPGYEIGPAYDKIPPSRFYIKFYDREINHACFFDECGLEASIVGTMGGWFSGSGTSASDDLFGVPIDEQGNFKKNYSSLFILADHKSKIVGLYLGATVKDVEYILRLHPNIADFKLLKGIPELGPLKVGQLLPKLPHDVQMEVPPIETVPHRFSYYWVRAKPQESPSCGYYECGFYVEKPLLIGGWYYEITHLQSEAVEMLGLSTSQLARGELNLMILTDAQNKILSLHPNKHLRDIITILMQHPEVADFSTSALYNP